MLLVLSDSINLGTAHDVMHHGLTTRQAVEHVMKGNRRPMRVSEIIEQAVCEAIKRWHFESRGETT